MKKSKRLCRRLYQTNFSPRNMFLSLFFIFHLPFLLSLSLTLSHPPLLVLRRSSLAPSHSLPIVTHLVILKCGLRMHLCPVWLCESPGLLGTQFVFRLLEESNFLLIKKKTKCKICPKAVNIIGGRHWF